MSAFLVPLMETLVDPVPSGRPAGPAAGVGSEHAAEVSS
ncbi:hypothetical protein CLV72_10110 [Allonocardiopsis opalescens]|uniref:Uncharacterized protein n=1 Tax=Allonocardiopsis opalescens TaxID=1144618 RepID=A0A2T0QC03_9ACTN|nr:hypothetical protein CLV72_10110 [Allonocardiopsis opalescens]